MKYIIIALLLLFITTHSTLFINGQDSSQGETKDYDNLCYGTTLETCKSGGACCLWCGDLKANKTGFLNESCSYISSLTDCPITGNGAFDVGCENYNIASCSCNLRATIKNSSSSNFNHNPYVSHFITIISTILVLFHFVT